MKTGFPNYGWQRNSGHVSWYILFALSSREESVKLLLSTVLSLSLSSTTILAQGIISIVAGNGSIASTTGDGGPATSAGLGFPAGVAADSSGNVYIADTLSKRV